MPTIAFQPQSPILFDQTIRANILFGIPESQLDEKRLRETLEASTLDLDMADPESTLHAKRELTQCGQVTSCTILSATWFPGMVVSLAIACDRLAGR